MKASLILGAALAAGANAAAIEARQRPRPTSTRGGSNPSVPDVTDCGLDSFLGHTSEALLMCSSVLISGTATRTATFTSGSTTTVKTTVYVTLYPSTLSSKTGRPTTTTRGPTPTPSAPPGCGIVGYTKNTAAYYFDSSGTKNTFAACSAACKADTQCKSFGYGEANCMLFTVDAASNTNYNPMSPYTFYDANCPTELPVKKRQLNITLILGPSSLSSACSCLITSGPAGTTRTTSVTVTSAATSTQTVTRTVSLLPGDDRIR